MARFPADAPKERVLRALRSLGVELVREGEHIAMRRSNADGSVTPLTLAVRLYPHFWQWPGG